MTKKIETFYGIKLVIDENVYEPAEDTFLLLETAQKIIDCKKKPSILEIGCGSGLISIILSKKGCKVTATDISPITIEIAKLNAKINKVAIDFRLGDLFEPVKSEVFDYILFNPPYLPEDEFDFLIQKEYLRTIVGGKKGNETILRFLKSLPNHLKPKGKAIFIASSLSNIEEILKYCSKQKLGCEIIASKKFFFEEIYAILAQRKE